MENYFLLLPQSVLNPHSVKIQHLKCFKNKIEEKMGMMLKMAWVNVVFFF